MITDHLKALRSKTLFPKQLINDMFSRLGGYLYWYLLYLNNTTNRKVEAELVLNVRNGFFAIRKTFADNDFISNKDVAAMVKELFLVLDTQVKMLGTVPERHWERDALIDHVNEVLAALHYFTDLAIEDAEREASTKNEAETLVT